MFWAKLACIFFTVSLASLLAKENDQNNQKKSLFNSFKFFKKNDQEKQSNSSENPEKYAKDEQARQTEKPEKQMLRDYAEEEIWDSYFYGTSIREITLVFLSAPDEIKNIVSHLRNPNYLNRPDYRYEFFTGEPGVGKTTLAKAIAYYSGWHCIYLTCSDLQAKGRNETAILLTQLFNDAIRRNIKTIIIIDELNELLENYDNPHFDNGATAKALWTFLDKQQGNENFFFIGTMNRVDKLPKQIKSRILARLTIINPPNTLEKIKQIFINQFLIYNIYLTDQAKEYISANIKKFQRVSARYIKELSLAAIKFAAQSTSKKIRPLLITDIHLEKAEKYIATNMRAMKYDEEEENPEERRHRESMQLQERLFVQGQLMQTEGTSLSASAGFMGFSISASTPIGKKNAIAKNLTSEQKKIAAQLAKNNARRNNKR